MTTQTFNVRRGIPVPSVDHLTLAEVKGRRSTLQRRLTELRGTTPSGPEDTDERRSIKAEITALETRSRELKEAEKADRQRRAFAGVGSPFYDAVRERMGEGSTLLMVQLEARALELLTERERRNAERRAKGAAKLEARTG
jgi:hypothetical protein